MVFIALILRLIVMCFLYPEQMEVDRDHWRFAYETGRIASSIASGHGFGNPLFTPTGPTAWMTPVYPLIVAGVFKLFGIYSLASAIVMLSFNALTSALTCIPVFLFARRGFGDRVATRAGWTWAFFPYAVYFPVERIWETWLATLLLAILFLWTLRLDPESEGFDPAKQRRSWLGYGAMWGCSALVSPALLAVAPFLGLWLIYRLHRRKQPWLVSATAGVLLSIVVVTPWFIRNYVTFHRFIPFRDNMGLVLRLGNKGPTDYWAASELGPWHSDAEWQEFKTVGELAYMDHKKQQAIAFIQANPGWYTWMAARRAVFLWFGYWSFDPAYLKEEPLDPPNIFFATTTVLLALAGLRKAFKHRRVAMPYLLVLFFFPLVYYITTPEAYYKRPIDTMLVVLAVYAVTRERPGDPEGLPRAKPV